VRDLALSERGKTPAYSLDPSRADYACPAYQEMVHRWKLVEDVRAGTMRFRAERETYLPKFEAEEEVDWNARVNMTFAEDHYALTVVDHVGLVFQEPVELSDDVPPQIVALAEDIDGEGNHLDVFAATALDSAIHLGHAVLLTDFPVTDAVRNLRDARDAKVRPYVTLYSADDVLSWRTETVGGVAVLVQLMLREHATEAGGEFGVKDIERFREFRQAVTYDETTKRARSLGPVTWREFLRPEPGAPPVEVATGTLKGPKRIPVRVVYGGEKLGALHTRPHLFGLALLNVEEAQVQSDYASVMHKCNVPTPIFIGRQKPPTGTAETIKMGQGIDVPVGGDAKMLEPSGTALGATRQRLEDIRAAMARQGATSGEALKNMTAREAAIQEKQRNAKLARAARSLQDALEGVFQDIAAFLKLPSGGSAMVNMDFSSQRLDPAYLQVLLNAYAKGALPLDAFMRALQTGKLPDDFAAEEAALRLIAESAADVEEEVVDEDEQGMEEDETPPMMDDAAA
jgi:hypothetical protein